MLGLSLSCRANRIGIKSKNELDAPDWDPGAMAVSPASSKERRPNTTEYRGWRKHFWLIESNGTMTTKRKILIPRNNRAIDKLYLPRKRTRDSHRAINTRTCTLRWTHGTRRRGRSCTTNINIAHISMPFEGISVQMQKWNPSQRNGWMFHRNDRRSLANLLVSKISSR